MKKKLAEFFNLIFGFRKFLLMLFVLTVAIVFRVKSLINGSEMVDLVKATTIAFFGANGVEHIMTVVKGAMEARGANNAPLDQAPADTNEADDNEEVDQVTS